MINRMLCLILVLVLSSLTSCSRKKSREPKKEEGISVSATEEITTYEIKKEINPIKIVKKQVFSIENFPKMSEADWMLFLAGRTRKEIYEIIGKPSSVSDAGYSFTYFDYLNYDPLTSTGQWLTLEFDKKTELLSDNGALFTQNVAEIIGRHYSEKYLPIPESEKTEANKSYVKELVGKWGNAGIIDYIFNEDGSGSIYYKGELSNQLSWKISDDILSFDVIGKDNKTRNQKYRVLYIKGGILCLRSGLGEYPTHGNYFYCKLPYKPMKHELFE